MGLADQYGLGSSRRRGSLRGAYLGGGSGGGSDSARSRLNSAVQSARREDDGGGLLGFAKDIADKVGLDSAANVVMRGLEIADFGRAAALSTAIEGMDVLSAVTGGFIRPTEETDKFAQSGISLGDIFENTRNRVGFGDYLEADPEDRNLPINVKRALGFTGDVGLDPLTYLTGGASTAAEGTAGAGRVARRLFPAQRELLSTEDVATRLIRGGDEEAAETVLRGRSAASAPAEALEGVGVRTGATFGRRWRVAPLDGVVDAMSRARGRARARVAETFARRMSPERWARFERVPGATRIRRSGIENAHVRALEWTLAWRDAGFASKKLRVGAAEQLNELFGEFGDVDRDSLRRGLEGEAVDNPAVAPMREFFDGLLADVNQATGRSIPRLDDYLAHQLTAEARDLAGRGKRTSGTPGGGFTKQRKVKGTIDEANQEFLDGVDDALKEKLGGKALFREDPWEIAAAYIEQVSRFVRFEAFERSVKEAGLIKYFDKPAVKRALKVNKRADRQAAKAARRAGKAKVQLEEAVRGAVDPQTSALGRGQAQEVKAAARGANVADLDAELEGIEEELLGLAEESRRLEAPGVIEAAEGEKEKLEIFRRFAQETAEGAEAELERPAAAAADELVAADREVKRLQAQRRRALKQGGEELSTKERRLRALQAMRDAGAPETAVREAEEVFRQGYRSGGRDMELLYQLEERFGLGGQDVVDVGELDGRIADAKAQRKSLREAAKELPATEPREALTARLERARQVKGAAESEIRRRVRIIEEHQALLETDYVLDGDVSELVRANEARIAELETAKSELKTARGKARASELAHRREAQRLFAAAEEETDLTLQLQARFEAQANQAEADLLKWRKRERAELEAHKVIKDRDLEMLQAVKDGELQKITGKRNLWAHPETAKAILDLKEAFKPEQVGKLLRLHDQVMARWKAYSLLSPGYHFRNGYSAMFMNQVAGYDGGIMGYYRFGKLWRRAKKDGIDAALKDIKNPKYADAFRATWDMRGVLFGGQVGSDFADIVSGGARRKGVLPRVPDAVDPTSLDNVLLRKNVQGAETVERLVRGPLFIDSLMKGQSLEEAYEKVVRFHFDYSEGITQFERNVLKRVIPFYTWTRLNFPLQLEYMARRPGVYTKYTHAKRNLEHGTEEEQFVPEYLEELGAIRMPAVYGNLPFVGGEQTDQGQFYFAPDLPFLRLGQTLDVDQAAAQLSPIVKTPLELDRGSPYFSDIPFREGYQRMPRGWSYVAPVLEIAGGRFGLPQVEQIDGQYYFASEREKYKLEQALPLLGRMRRLLPNTEREQDRALSSWLSFLAGLSGLRNTPRQQENEMRRREQQINDLVEAARRRREVVEEGVG